MPKIYGYNKDKTGFENNQCVEKEEYLLISERIQI